MILAVDQGTTSTKAHVVTAEGVVVASSSAPVGRAFPRPGWVEQDGRELWQSVEDAVAQLPDMPLDCIATTSQRESVMFWERSTGRPLTPVVGWQCTRGAALCAELVAGGADSLVRGLSGLPLDPMFSASKLRWLLDADPDLRAAADDGAACAGTIDSWLVWNLSGGAVHVTDAGNASRTLLLDLHRLDWSEELLQLFEIPRACLPAVISSGGPLGESAGRGDDRRLPALPIAAVTADSHAALYGLGCVRPGTAKATYGTGSSVMAAAGHEPSGAHGGLASTVAWLAGRPTYALEGNVFSSGATVEWVSKLLGLAGPDEVEKLANRVANTGGVRVVPAFSGLGAPWWRPEERGRIVGLTFASGRGELALAAVESIAYQVADVVGAVERNLERPLEELHVDGGGSRNDRLLQLQADLTGCPVVRSEAIDAAAVGAALIAAAAMGWRDDAPTPAAGVRFEPRVDPSRRHELLERWHAAVGVQAVREEAAVR